MSEEEITLTASLASVLEYVTADLPTTKYTENFLIGYTASGLPIYAIPAEVLGGYVEKRASGLVTTSEEQKAAENASAQVFAHAILDLLRDVVAKAPEDDSATLAFYATKSFLGAFGPCTNEEALKVQLIMQRAIEKVRGEGVREQSEEYEDEDTSAKENYLNHYVKGSLDNAAFFGLRDTKQYYPIATFHKFLSSPYMKEVFGEYIQLIYFVSEEEAVAEGYAPAHWVQCPDCGQVYPPEDWVFCEDCGAPFERHSKYKQAKTTSSIKYEDEDSDEWDEDDEEDTEKEEDDRDEPPDLVPLPSATAYASAYQEQERYQPPAGKYRLGRDIQTGDYVDAPQAGRREGLYLIGTPGTGKTGLIENLIVQDIKQGMGVGLLDPHGDVTQAVLSRVPDRREQDVIYLDITDYHYPFGINLFACSDLTDPREVQKTIDQVFHVFEKLLGVTQETQLILEYLYNCTSTLIANPGYTMADIPLLLQDRECRRKLVARVSDSDVQRFWQLHEQKKPADQNNDIASTLRRVRRFLQPLSRPIVGQSRSTIDVQTIMDEGKILLVKLDAQLDSITNLVGSVLIALFLNAAYARPANRRRQFNLYADEFQRFATEDFATLLTEARKFGIATTIAHQARFQPGMTDGIRATTLSAKNLVVFKVNSQDADELAGEFDITPQAAWEELIEPEQIKVLRPQAHEWREMQVEDEVEEDITEISQNPVEYLKSARGTHENVRVREAAQTFLSLFATLKYPSAYEDELNKLLVDVMEGRVKTGTVQLAERIEPLLYEFFYHIRTPYPANYAIESWLNKDINYLSKNYFWAQNKSRLLRVSSDEVNEQDVKRLLNKDNFDNLFYDDLNPEQWGYPFLVQEKLHRLAEQHEAMQQSVAVLLREMVIKSSSLSTAEKQLHAILSDYFVELARLSHFNNMERQIREIHSEEIYIDVHKDRETWNALGKYWLTKDWEPIEKKLKQEKRSEKIMQVISHFKEGWHLTEKSVLAYVPVAVNDVTTFARNILCLCEGLAKEPIMVPTGQKRLVPKKRTVGSWISHESEKITIPRKTIMHPQRTYADVHNEVASQLTNQDNFIARVRYINADQRRVECSIRTLDPKQDSEKPLFGQALEERIARIKEWNIQNGYLRERAIVEAEIRQRQEQCSQPPEDEPPISRRPSR
jgi:hypothetical protein